MTNHRRSQSTHLMTFSKPHTPNFYLVRRPSVRTSKSIVSSAPISFQRLLQPNFQNTKQPTENKPKSFLDSSFHSNSNESIEGSDITTSGTEYTKLLTESASTFAPPIHNPVHDAECGMDDLGPLLGMFYLCPAHQNLT